MTRIDMLKDVGVEIGFKQDYDREKREYIDRPDVVATINPGFTATEWVSLTMRDPPESMGIDSMYVGGCCANMSALQDEIMGVYRDGYFMAATFLECALMARNHDGFEEFKETLTEEQFAATLARWDHLDPWQKLGVIYQAASDKLVPKTYHGVGARSEYIDDPEERAIRELSAGLAYLNWKGAFPRDREGTGQQRHANDLLARARIYQPTQMLMEALNAKADAFDGFAIVRTGTDEIMRNGFGQTIFDSREAAEEVVGLWAKMEDESPRDRTVDVEIVPVHIDTREGVKLR